MSVPCVEQESWSEGRFLATPLRFEPVRIHAAGRCTHARLAQWRRAPGYELGRRGFESLSGYHGR